jgi:hypothetical protein
MLSFTISSLSLCRIDLVDRSEALAFLESEERRAAAQQGAAREAPAAARKGKGKAAALPEAEDEEALEDAMEED